MLGRGERREHGPIFNIDAITGRIERFVRPGGAPKLNRRHGSQLSRSGRATAIELELISEFQAEKLGLFHLKAQGDGLPRRLAAQPEAHARRHKGGKTKATP
jgi:hypothetical protein